MFDIEEIKSGIVRFTAEVLQSQLTTIGTPNGDIPAVIKLRQDGTKPDKPYVTVDIGAVSMPFGWILNRYFDEDGIDTYEVLLELSVEWRCYGDTSLSVLNHLNTLLSMPPIRSRLSDLTKGMQKSSIGTVESVPDLLSTRHEESSLMTGVFYIVSVIQNPIQEGDFISFYDINGNLITGVNGDIEVNINNLPDPMWDSTIHTFDYTNVTWDNS